ncbi:hypothetical protein TH8_14835 [Thalassospira profundimaris]|nr:hypothetical protein TH8_14835 [Thalassospira profundimaris]
MLPHDVVSFVVQVVRGTLECSVADLKNSVDDFKDLPSLAVIRELMMLCERHNISVSPGLTDGELSDRRLFSARPELNQFVQEADKALEAGQENGRTEFKQTFFLNVRRFERDPESTKTSPRDEQIIHSSVKTVCGFLNAEGGILLIGVKDNADIYGVQEELPFLPTSEKTLDNWELFFWDKLKASIFDFNFFAPAISGAFVQYEDRSIFVVLVHPVQKRLCICKSKDRNDEVVYLRTGNKTSKLSIREIEMLVSNRSLKIL